MSERVVYMNGEMVRESDAKISIYDSALMFGDMVFEMTRSFDQHQFKLSEHIERLYNGLRILRIPIDISPAELEDICLQTVDLNMASFAPDDEHRLMIDVSRGLLDIYSDIPGLHRGVNIIVADFPLRWTVSGMGELFEHGINAVIPSQRTIPAQLLDNKIKNRSRLHFMMANIEVSRAKGDRNWALLLDPDGFIAEGTGDNFFIVKDGLLLTPEGRNILRGISRDYVIDELAPDLGLKVIETNIGSYDVYCADEAFMTGTPFCLLPVTSLNGIAIGDGSVGPIYSRLLAKWSDNVRVDICGQIQEWDKRGDDLGELHGVTPYQFGSD